MTLQPKYISYLVILVLVAIIAMQYHGATKAEQRAAQLEAQAKDIDAQLQKFEQESRQQAALAESRYQASLAESANLRTILAKGSQARPQNGPPSHQEPITALPQPDKPSTPSQAAQAVCEPFIYQGQPLVIESFQVAVCDGKPVVQAEAAVAYHDEVALVAKLNTQLADATAKLVLEDKDLAAYKLAEAGYRKAAKKSRIKKVLGVAEKLGLFVGGIYLGKRL